MVRLVQFLALAALTVTSFAAGASRSAVFDGLVVFGDSLSDAGNAGRFTNGEVWVEGLAARLGLRAGPSAAGGSNFAVGGARLDPASGPASIPAQVRSYTDMSADPSGHLFVVYGGGNDLIAATSSAMGEAMVTTALSALEAVLVELAAHGARDFLVPNLPDITMIPAARGQSQFALDRARRLTERFNDGLAAILDRLEARYPVRMYRLDIHSMAERARRNPASFGFDDVSAPCRSLPSCDGYLFWDDVHPTAEAHSRMAEAAAALLGAR